MRVSGEQWQQLGLQVPKPNTERSSGKTASGRLLRIMEPVQGTQALSAHSPGLKVWAKHNFKEHFRMAYWRWVHHSQQIHHL